MDSRILYCAVLFCGGMFLFCIACAGPPVPVSFPPPHRPSKEQIIEAVKKETFAFLSLKSLVKVKISYPLEDKRKRQSFEGALLYKESGEFRFQGFGFLGRTLFDLVYKPNELVLYIPSSSIAYEGAPSPLTSFKDADMFSIARKIIMGIGETYDQATFHFPQDIYSPHVDNGTGQQLLFRINPNNLRIDKKIVFQNGEITAEIDYRNYKKVGQKLFPILVTLFLPAQQTTIRFDFEDLTVDQVIPDSLFTLSLPSHVKRLPLSEFGTDFPAAPST